MPILWKRGFPTGGESLQQVKTCWTACGAVWSRKRSDILVERSDAYRMLRDPKEHSIHVKKCLTSDKES